MIHVDREKTPFPKSLGTTGVKERKKALAHYKNADSSTKAYPFKAYKGDDVKLALDRLFHGKCAYCEAVYASVQPMDVEHWRPKGEIKFIDENGTKKSLKPGYYWLAAEWSNLLPSCIDCNRQRNQYDIVPPSDAVAITSTGIRTPEEDPNQARPLPSERDLILEKIGRGKKNLFPVLDDAYIRNPEDFKKESETVLILHPCEDHPEEFLQFVEGAIVRPLPANVLENPPANQEEKALCSIEVYGLNRSRLVYQREEHLLEIKAHLYTVEQLMKFFDTIQTRKTKRNTKLRQIATDLLEHEMNTLRRYCRPERPFALMARQVIDDFFEGIHSPLGGGERR